MPSNSLASWASPSRENDSIKTSRVRRRVPPEQARDFDALAEAMEPAPSIRQDAENAVSPDLPMLLGRKPRSLSEFLEDHQNAFSS
jgi:hypothetical protein